MGQLELRLQEVAAAQAGRLAQLVDSFLAAGLPMDVLKWCIDKAGASKAAPDQTWRYMCGVAWKKVTELQQAARVIAGGEEASAQDAARKPPISTPRTCSPG